MPATRPSRPLIIGADGLLGAALMRRMPDALGAGRRPVPGRLFLDLAALPGDWRPPPEVATAFLCAFVNSFALCQADPRGTALINVEAQIRLSEILMRHGVRVVFPSSNAVFDGATAFPDETAPPRPTTEYGRQKLAVERWLASATADHAVVRLTKVVGPSFPLFNEWRDSLTRGQAITPHRGVGTAPIALDFAVEALIRAAACSTRALFHVSPDADIAYDAIAEHMACRLGASPTLVRPIDPPAGPGGSPPALGCAASMAELGLIAPPPLAAIDDFLAPRR